MPIERVVGGIDPVVGQGLVHRLVNIVVRGIPQRVFAAEQKTHKLQGIDCDDDDFNVDENKMASKSEILHQ